jgi:DNA-binding transcriptional MocR family regulator
MTDSWVPELTKDNIPLYHAIADAIEHDVMNGTLRTGIKMPTHRTLANQLKVTVATVTRAYAKACERGLLVGEVGRGTYVRGARARAETRSSDIDVIDFRLNQPPTIEVEEILAREMGSFGERVRTQHLLSYQMAPGSLQQRAAGARWAALAGVDVDPSRLVITNGAQQALMATFTVLTQPGDLVLTESLTYPGIRSLADLFRVRIKGLEMDDDGVVPESFEAACREGPVAAIYLTPTIHNPTATTLPLERRVEIAQIASRHNVPIVEDDIYGPLVGGNPPPIFTMAENDCYYIFGTSKTVAPGLRIGYLIAPPRMVQYLANAVHSTTWSAPPINTEIVTSWIESGTAERILTMHRAESSQRLALARDILSGFDAIIPDIGYHIWLRLPKEWRSSDFVHTAHANGVAVSPRNLFTVDPADMLPAVRVSLGLPQTASLVEEGLIRLRDTLLGHDMPKNLII